MLRWRFGCLVRFQPAVARLRLGALMALSLVVLHELSYAVSGVRGEHGHGYLGIAAPIVTVAVTATILGLLCRTALGAPAPPHARSSLGRALRCALALFSIYVAQELLEAALSPGHPGGLDALASQLPATLPLALALGVVVQALARGLEAAERAVAAAIAHLRIDRGLRADTRESPLPRAARWRSGLAFGFARRPPPELSPTG